MAAQALENEIGRNALLIGAVDRVIDQIDENFIRGRVHGHHIDLCDYQDRVTGGSRGSLLVLSSEGGSQLQPLTNVNAPEVGGVPWNTVFVLPFLSLY